MNRIHVEKHPTRVGFVYVIQRRANGKIRRNRRKVYPRGWFKKRGKWK
jgi:hypothetical protein